jgi:NDP-4-keto-2,6-dideoxyhexose 3-C-methyltransferase
MFGRVYERPLDGIMMSMSDDLVTTRKTCRICGKGNLVPIISLGDLYVSDFLQEADEGRSFKAPLELVFCDLQKGGCGLLQLRHTVSHEVMYRNYWYRSGINQTMTNELNDIARTVEALVGLTGKDFVIDIGANDGTLLRGYSVNGLNRIGYEPANNLEQYNSVGTTKVFKDFFNAAAWKNEFSGKKAKAITAIAMFYDLEDPNAFVSDIADVLDEEGVFVVQQSYLPLMLETNEVGNICHEHLEYYSLLSMEGLMKRHDLEIFDVEVNDINGGSFRTYIRHRGKGASIRVVAGASERVQSMRSSEAKLALGTIVPYQDFVSRLGDIQKQCIVFLKEEVSKGKRIYGYGASTKGNTLLQYFGIGPDLIIAIADRNEDKWGKKTVGTDIPIVSEADARAAKPDYFFILPWHFLKEFREREKEFFARGGKFIVPMPHFAVIEN